MNLDIRGIKDDSTVWEVTRKIADFFHAQDFGNTPDLVPRKVNFKVVLNESKLGGIRNNGSGRLTLPTRNLGEKFMRCLKREDQEPIIVDGKKLKFFPALNSPPDKYLALTLDKTPYVSPDIEQDRDKAKRRLGSFPIRIEEVQFGAYYRDSFSPKGNPRSFSVEWFKNYVNSSPGWLRFEYDYKLLRVELGDEGTEAIGYSISISFSSINKIAVGNDLGKPYVLFDTQAPPLLEELNLHRDHEVDRKFRRRIGSMDPRHETVSAYAQHLRLLLHDDNLQSVLDKFKELCQIAGLLAPVDIRRFRPPIVIECSQRGFFTQKKLYKFQNLVSGLDWPVAFQLEALLRNTLLNTEEIMGALWKPISDLYKEDSALAAQVLKHFGEALLQRDAHESPLQCFQRVRSRHTMCKQVLFDGNFLCYHVTFAPTRLLLEGPYATKSNRIIRRYPGYEENFIRVDFRDEDRLQLRWERESDGTTFLQQRVGETLRNGFTLAGRNFQFLAYSSSALREHAVWFMSSFDFISNETGKDVKTRITPGFIRESLGDFSNVIKFPSKYAARIAQAFTATDPSIKIRRNQWHEIKDIEVKRLEGQNGLKKNDKDKVPIFTDGVGSISLQLRDQIWEKLCESKQDRGETLMKPWAFQIRFLGYKGVVVVDERLEGVYMHLRESMKKFKGTEKDEDEIEIARAFDTPNSSYLNRAVVMILEDREVNRKHFEELQEKAVAEARTIDDSVDTFRTVLNSHKLGNSFSLSETMKLLKENLGLDIQNNADCMDNPFFRALRQVAMNHVLRDIKHNARIRVPDAFLLVGVADLGPAYEADGIKNVIKLNEGEIYACVQKPGEENPTWLSGQCTISRSPAIHPVQRVRAVGKPPDEGVCFFRNLKNVVVLPSVGKRPLASCLGGGDLDGDLYDVVPYSPLLPSRSERPAEYPPTDPKGLDDDRDSTVDDICNFIVEYIHSDVLGLISVRHLIIADQSRLGTLDPSCLRLARLHSKAVDYPKNGVPVDLQENPLPRTLIRCKPDWNAAEVISPRHTDYYESNRALGHMFRAITITEAPRDRAGAGRTLHSDPISVRLQPLVARQLPSYSDPDGKSPEAEKLLAQYTYELLYVCATHTLSNTPGVRLIEEEVVIGTILAKCSDRRWRKDRVYRMALHGSTLAENVRNAFIEPRSDGTAHSDPELREGLQKAWVAWDLSLRKDPEFGACSFGLIALGTIFSCLKKLGEGFEEYKKDLNGVNKKAL